MEIGWRSIFKMDIHLVESSQQLLNDSQKYGSLLSPDIEMHRKYFNEMVRLIGIQAVYYAPRTDKHYTLHGELLSNYQDPEVVGAIFNEYPDQRSMRKRGWVVELQEGASLISVPYDLHDLQRGALFAIPSGIDNTQGRLFRVESLITTMIYPSSVTCEIVPEWEDTLPDSKLNRQQGDFQFLAQEDPDVF